MTLAHGIGSQHDLPISPFYAFAGAFTALFVSFLALGLLWSASRFRGDRSGVALPAGLQRVADAPATRTALRGLGLAASLAVLLYLLLGPDDPARNPAPGAVYVLLWVGLVPASLLLGPVWRLLNPLRTLHRLLARLAGRLRTARPAAAVAAGAAKTAARSSRSPRPPAPHLAVVPDSPGMDSPGMDSPDVDPLGVDPPGPEPRSHRPLPARLGQWPAAAGLFAFTWLELVSPDPASTTTLLIALTGYAAVQLLFAARYGERWFADGDAFEAYSALLARLSPLGRRSDGRLVLRNPFHGLDATPERPGLVATVCVLLGSTAYDGFSDNPSWINAIQTSPLGRTPAATLGLAGAIALVAALYCLCAAVTRLVCGPHPGPLTAFAHSLVPIALGYLVAHYFSLLVTEGPRTVIMAVGTDNAPEPLSPLDPGGLAALQVIAVVTGHVLGVIAAHDRSVRLFPPAKAVVGQLPLLALMITYTVGGLSLLLN
ncbi:hypothetical protein OG898_23165 [Streptomyces sp. NBC_00193]|uniref:hypothetical protein n=1 Tax=Streptomyces sp. NBC_00193 TaxID=2975675 RepID=UPI0022528682|nr:hypothetical protein [Streptomyces sp. NBC_00193]MCX5299355.1 hypothetical protein [Streptomyces sp. NBC_00193]